MARYIAFSTASMQPIAEGDTIEQALARATRGGPNTPADDQFLVVAEVGPGVTVDTDELPVSAPVVWRGSNELAQRFRK